MKSRLRSSDIKLRSCLESTEGSGGMEARLFLKKKSKSGIFSYTGIKEDRRMFGKTTYGLNMVGRPRNTLQEEVGKNGDTIREMIKHQSSCKNRILAKNIFEGLEQYSMKRMNTDTDVTFTKRSKKKLEEIFNYSFGQKHLDSIFEKAKRGVSFEGLLHLLESNEAENFCSKIMNFFLQTLDAINDHLRYDNSYSRDEGEKVEIQGNKKDEFKESLIRKMKQDNRINLKSFINNKGRLFNNEDVKVLKNHSDNNLLAQCTDEKNKMKSYFDKKGKVDNKMDEFKTQEKPANAFKLRPEVKPLNLKQLAPAPAPNSHRFEIASPTEMERKSKQTLDWGDVLPRTSTIPTPQIERTPRETQTTKQVSKIQKVLEKDPSSIIQQSYPHKEQKSYLKRLGSNVSSQHHEHNKDLISFLKEFKQNGNRFTFAVPVFLFVWIRVHSWLN